jgi:hypothetical protein
MLGCLMYNSNFNNELISGFGLLVYVFDYYKVTIATVFSILLISSTINSLGIEFAIFLIITVILIYYNKIPINIFNKMAESNLSPVTSFNQATKISCKEVYQSIKDIKGGGSIKPNMDIIKQIKKINKILGK